MSKTVEKLMRDWQKRRAPVMTARTRATNAAPVDIICDLYGNYTLDDSGVVLTLNHVEEFRNILLEKGMSKLTAARYLSTLRAGLGEEGSHLKIGKLIAELKREPLQIDCWTKEEAKKIISEAHRKKELVFPIFINFLFYTGMRRGEALALQGSDIEFDRGKIHIHRALTLDGELQNGTKWGGERWFPMGKRLHEMVERYAVDVTRLRMGEGYKAVFPGLDQRTVGRQFNCVRDAAGVRPFKMHCTRHSAISWALSAGMSLRKASEIFGVSQATLEKHYAHYVEEEVNMDWANL